MNRFLLGIGIAIAMLAALSYAEPPTDKILIEKSARRLTLFHAGKQLHSYKVSLGAEPKGAKAQQGDHRTPEGNYFIDSRNAQSHYYKALHISYPSNADRERARKLGVNPGGDIMIHGLPNGQGFVGKAHLLHDWTDGCIAVTNEEMDEIWKLVPIGTPVEIRP